MKQSKRLITTILLIAVATLLLIVPVLASDYIVLDEVYIEDNCGLLEDYEEDHLISDMLPITEYGKVAFVTDETHDGEAEAKRKFYSLYNYGESAIIFYIDMQSRKLVIYSDGNIYKKITSSKANEITNSVYREARSGHYYECASNVYKQIYSVLTGKGNFSPMRLVHNFFLSIIFVSSVLYLIAYISRIGLMNVASNANRTRYIKSRSQIQFFNLDDFFIRRVHHNSSSGGSSGGGGGSSGRGGGGSSGF